MDRIFPSVCMKERLIINLEIRTVEEVGGKSSEMNLKLGNWEGRVESGGGGGLAITFLCEFGR